MNSKTTEIFMNISECKLCGRRVTVERTILDYINLIKKKFWLIMVFVLISCATTYYVSKNFVVPSIPPPDSCLLTTSQMCLRATILTI